MDHVQDGHKIPTDEAGGAVRCSESPVLTPSRNARFTSWLMRLNWGIVSALTAVLALSVSFLFNTLQSMHATRAVQAQRLAVELQTFSQVHYQVNSSLSQLIELHGEEIGYFLVGNSRTLSHEARSSLAQATNNLEYMAWLFNRHYVSTLDGSAELWLSPMRQLTDLKISVDSKLSGRDLTSNFSDFYPELSSFLAQHGRTTRPSMTSEVHMPGLLSQPDRD